MLGGIALDLRPSLLPVCDRVPDKARPLDLVEASLRPARLPARLRARSPYFPSFLAPSALGVCARARSRLRACIRKRSVDWLIGWPPPGWAGGRRSVYGESVRVGGCRWHVCARPHTHSNKTLSLARSCGPLRVCLRGQTFGPAYDKALNPFAWAVLVLILAFIIPFYRADNWWVWSFPVDPL